MVTTDTVKLWKPDGSAGGGKYYSHPKQQRKFGPRLPTTQRNVFTSLYRTVSTSSSSSINWIHLTSHINSKKIICQNAVKFFKCFRTTKPLLFH